MIIFPLGHESLRTGAVARSRGPRAVAGPGSAWARLDRPDPGVANDNVRGRGQRVGHRVVAVQRPAV